MTTALHILVGLVAAVAFVLVAGAIGFCMFFWWAIKGWRG